MTSRIHAPAEGASADPAPLSPRQLKQILGFTVAAIALYLLVRWLPTGTNLQHADFSVSGAPGSTLEFCDPANPQFLPVVAVRSPIETRAQSVGPVIAGEPAEIRLQLQTTTGKPIGDVDLLVSHTEKLHVMAIDPTLTDYHHLHPRPGSGPGEWIFSFTPAHSGVYRLFCDFTPAATARGLYSNVDIEVAPAEEGGVYSAGGDAIVSPAGDDPELVVERDGYVFTLIPSRERIRARERTELSLGVRRPDGERVELGEIMGAFAHLVAFDLDRSGFAHLHPKETDLSKKPDPVAPRLTFDVTIPESGRYAVWAQLVLDGREIYVPFWLQVAP